MKKLLLTLLPLLFLACGSAPESVNSDAPPWISQHPDDAEGYYIGISGANTGSQSDDKEQAYDKALKALASAISASIQSSSTFIESGSNDNLDFSSFENSISTNVSQNLADVETADSYYSEETGYWFYLRLSQDRWNELVEERADDLKDQVEDLFFDTFRDSLSELKTIDRAMKAFYAAYSGQPIKMELFGQRGSVDTLLTLRAEKLLQEMSIQWVAFPRTFQQGETVKLTGQVVLYNQDGSPTEYTNPGALTLQLIDQNDRIVVEVATERNGIFDLDIKEMDAFGDMTYTLSLQNPFTDPMLASQVSYAFPSTVQQVTVNPMIIGFDLEANWSSYGQKESAFNALRDLMPVELTSDPAMATSALIRMDISYRLAPPNDYGMVFSYAKCFISLIDNKGEAILWESPEYKAAGLDENQANTKATEAMLEAINLDVELAGVLRGLEF